MTEIDDILDPLLATFRTTILQRMGSQVLGIYLSGSAQMVEWGRTKFTDRPVFFEGPPVQEAINWAEKHCAKLVTQMDDETKNLLAKVISDGIENKRGIDGLARDIRRQFDDMSKVRSQTIARTETNAALSEGSFQRGKDLGITGKSWLTVGDDKVRDSHRQNEAAGVIPWNQPFPDGSMHPPGVDPFNCRCSLVPEMLPEK